MNWFAIALLNPILHAFINHFDKYLLSKYVKGGTVGALILFSALFAVAALPIIYLINPGVLRGIGLSQILILMINGAFLTIAILFYLYALDSDEASYVAPFFQLIPVFGFIIGWVVLREVLTKNQFFGGLLIVLGSIFLSFNFNTTGRRFKHKLVLLMLGSSFFYAINAVIFKYVAIDAGFVNSLFWDMLGKFIFGMLLFFLVKKYRDQFLHLIKANGKAVIGLNIINEVMGLVGEFALVLAVLYAPVALVQSVGGLQPLFVLIFGFLFTVFIPKFGTESLMKKNVLQKLLAVVIMLLGVYLIN